MSEHYITLIDGTKCLVDEDDLWYLQSVRWRRCGKKVGHIYARRNVKVGRKHIDVYMHKVIMNTSEQVDHINGDTLDNRKCNLRICKHLDNSRNRKMPSNNTLGAKGVLRSKTSSIRYEAKIGFSNKKIRLGSFDTIDEAAHAYNKAAIEIFGEFARLNPVGVYPRQEQSSE